MSLRTSDIIYNITAILKGISQTRQHVTIMEHHPLTQESVARVCGQNVMISLERRKFLVTTHLGSAHIFIEASLSILLSALLGNRK